MSRARCRVRFWTLESCRASVSPNSDKDQFEPKGERRICHRRGEKYARTTARWLGFAFCRAPSQSHGRYPTKSKTSWFRIASVRKRKKARSSSTRWTSVHHRSLRIVSRSSYSMYALLNRPSFSLDHVARSPPFLTSLILHSSFVRSSLHSQTHFGYSNINNTSAFFYAQDLSGDLVSTPRYLATVSFALFFPFFFFLFVSLAFSSSSTAYLV